MDEDIGVQLQLADLRRHAALMVVSEEALELTWRQDDAPAVLDLGAIERALEEARLWQLVIRFLRGEALTPEEGVRARAALLEHFAWMYAPERLAALQAELAPQKAAHGRMDGDAGTAEMQEHLIATMKWLWRAETGGAASSGGE